MPLMIPAGAEVRVARIPLSLLTVAEYCARDPKRLAHYLDLMARPEHAGAAPGLIAVEPDGGRYVVVDGHHRFCAHVMMGRPDALCVVIEPKHREGA